MSNLQAYYYFKRDFQKVDQHTEGKWFIYDASCQAWNSPVKYPNTECKHDIKESEGSQWYTLQI